MCLSWGIVACTEYDLSNKTDVSGGGTEPDILVDPQLLEYGVVAEGDSSSQSFVVTNEGDEDLLVDQVGLVVGDDLGYSLTLPEELPWILEPEDGVDVVATLTSQGRDLVVGEVRVGSNDPDEPELYVELVNEPYEESPPDEVIDGCETVSDVALDEEVYVLSWDESPGTGTLVAEQEGLFHVYSSYVAESGSEQTNETAYLRISNEANPDGTPAFANCNDDWVVMDLDNEEELPEDTVVYVGTFYILAGENTVSLYHYCPVYRDGECTDLHIDIDAESTCDGSNVNSVHFTGTAICLLPG